MTIASEKLLRTLSFGAQIPLSPNLGSKEIADLRSDVEAAFHALEGAVSMPRLTGLTGSVTDSDIGTASLDLVGTNFLAGRTQAHLAIGTGTALVTVTACRPGEAGNDLRIVFVDPAANSHALTVGIADSLITVTLATSNVGAITSTGNSVTAALNADTSIKQVIKAVSGGAGVVTAHSVKNLAGGTGSGLKVYIGGTEVAVDDKITDTAISILDGQAASFTGNSYVLVEVKSHTYLTSGLTLKVIAD